MGQGLPWTLLGTELCWADVAGSPWANAGPLAQLGSLSEGSQAWGGARNVLGRRPELCLLSELVGQLRGCPLLWWENGDA